MPFVEAVPFEVLLGPLLSGRGGWARWLAGGFRPGPEDTPLPVAGTKLGVSVCYEELFFDLQRGLRNAGARVQAVITNDAWFGTTFFQTYQANTRPPARHREPLVVRTGGEHGDLDVRRPARARRGADRAHDAGGSRAATSPLTDGRTVYDRIGDVPAWARDRDVASRRHSSDGGEAHEPEDDRPDLGAVSRPRPVRVRSGDRSRRHDRGARSDPARHRHDDPRGVGRGSRTAPGRARSPRRSRTA